MDENQKGTGALQQTDAASAAVAKTPNRVSLADIEANIEYEVTTNPTLGQLGLRKDMVGPLKLLTIHVIVLKNGFTVIGHSACADPANFDAKLGRKIARDNAIREIWPLMGYHLRQKLHEEG